MTDIAPEKEAVDEPAISQTELDTLRSVERRILWLAARIVDFANRERPKTDELKVGGHQASSASMVSLMTALYLRDLRAEDRVSLKPHASPVLHAIEYLLGRLDRSYLTRLREFDGLQSYPSITKDHYPVDYSTGSVGIGSAAPLFGALANRYVDDHFDNGTGGRFISLLGDAELDEGNLWEAVIEPQTRDLGNVLWVVDLNRQSLDRVVPIIKAAELQQQFATCGWQVIELKYGSHLREAYAKDGGDVLRRRIDEMPNQLYQSLFGASEELIHEALLRDLSSGDHKQLDGLLEEYRGHEGTLIRDLGGHDLGDLLGAYAAARRDTTRPTVVFAYTIKGWGLPIAGRPMNHSALLTGDQIDVLREDFGLTPETEWDRFAEGTPEADVCANALAQLTREPLPAPKTIAIPTTIATRDQASTSTQAAVGRTLMDLSRIDEIAERIVTVSPDVSVSTNLGGWINKVGVYGHEEEPVYEEEEGSTLSWRVGPTGQHIELGISEMNLFLALGQLGMTRKYQGQPLIPIGTLYDPFVVRGLEGMLYGTYSGSKFIVLGTPSGVSLSREGGAHQSTITPSIGMELPGVIYAEPTYARELEWILLNHLRTMQEPDGESLYLRLTTKPVAQAPFGQLIEQRGEDAVRADVLAGAYWLREPSAAPDSVILVTCGALVPEVLEAADQLAAEEGVHAGVLSLSSPDIVYRNWRANRLTHLSDINARRQPSHLETLVPPTLRSVPIVTVIDGASHALSWLGGALGVRSVPLGVDTYGQVGDLASVYDAYDLSPAAVTTAALIALEH